MCLPGCREKVQEGWSRRRFLRAAAVASGVGALGCQLGSREGRTRSKEGDRSFTFRTVVDLTHTLTPAFPTFTGLSQLEIETISTVQADGYGMSRWSLVEHTGTHIDAPAHFAAGGQTADRLEAEDLVAPLVVLDLRERAGRDPDTRVTPDDVRAWQDRHGPLPEGCCVALNSGWDRKTDGPGFRNADASGTLHFPGFHVETAAYLLEEHRVAGIAVDTLSLDHGPSPDFAFHREWLPANRWGLECVANLDRVPEAGATLIAAAPKVGGASGGLTRVLALIP